MKELKTSEKNLILLVVITGLTFGWYKISQNGKKEVVQMRDRLAAVETNVRKTKEMLAQASSQPKKAQAKPKPSNEVTMAVLNALTTPKEIEGIDVTLVKRVSALDFQVRVSAKFSHLMKYISYLERSKSEFKVESVELNRLIGKGGASSEGDTSERMIKGVLNISKRG